MSTRFNCTIISLDQAAAERCSAELNNSPFLGAIDHHTSYPSDDTLARILRLNTVDLLLLDCSDLPRAIQIIELVRTHAAPVEIIALCQEDVKVLASLMRAGVRDYIPTDSPLNLLRETLANAVDKLRHRPVRDRTAGDIVTFLPSKPGSGASTIAAHAAFAASQSPAKRVLLVDFDHDAPVQAFLNGLHPEHFLQEALANSHQMDSDLWTRIVSQRDALDILPSDADGSPSAETGRVRDSLHFFRRAYDLTCIDLPGPLDSNSVEVLVEARRVYLVCTQELASIHIAIRKADRMKRLGLGKELRILLNRYDSAHVMNRERVADLAGLPVELTIPNSYALATASAEKGAYVAPSTPLGKSYAKLAQLLLNDRIEVPRKQRKFLEFLYEPFTRTNASEA
jgi:pilus assembly protein CpaE